MREDDKEFFDQEFYDFLADCFYRAGKHYLERIEYHLSHWQNDYVISTEDYVDASNLIYDIILELD